MGNTGNIFPGTGENNAGIGATAWTSPGNVVSDNATDATCNAAASSQYLVARNFSFGPVPANATIKGVLVRVEASEHSTGTEPLLAQLQDASGNLFGTGKSTSNEGSINGTTKAVYTYGSVSDLWGAALTPGIVNDVDFGVRLWFTTAHDVRIDFVTMQIQYQYELTASDSVTSSDAATKSATLNKSDSASTADAASKTEVLNKLDSATISDSANKSPTLNKVDSISVSDSAAKSTSLGKSDSITSLDEVVKLIGLNKDDSATLSDVFERIVVFDRLITDEIILSDLVSKSSVLNKTDLLTASDEIVKVFVKLLNDLITASENADVQLGGGGTDYFLEFSDSIGLTDLVSKVIGKMISDNISLSDGIFKIFGKISTDSITVSDLVAKGIELRKSDNITALDEFNRIVDVLLQSWVIKEIELDSEVTKEIVLNSRAIRIVEI